MGRDTRMENEAFIRLLYQSVLGREADSHGLQNQLAFLGDTPTFSDAVRMLEAFNNSEEKATQKGYFSPKFLDEVTVVSIGSHCITSGTLKKLGLKKWSGPFDWIFCSPKMVSHCIEDRFKIFLEKKYFEYVPDDAREHKDANFCDHRFYLDKFGIKFMFNHYDITQIENYEYYSRCIKRFMQNLESPQKTLFVNISRYIEDEELELFERIAFQHQNKRFLLFSFEENSKDFAAASVRHETSYVSIVDFKSRGSLGAVGFERSIDEVVFRQVLGDYAGKWQ